MPRFETLHRVRAAAALLRPRELALRPFRCPICGPSLVLRLARQSFAVRCVRCGASATTLSLIAALQDLRPAFRAEAIYEMSSRGPLVDYLRREAPNLTCSEYFDDVAPGERRGGVQCQDVQGLTFPDATFDLVTSTEVFEHVPDDALGFAEVRRVLRPGGMFLFTVPLSAAAATVERAVLKNGRLEHRLAPAFHGDRIRGQGKVLVYRDYGRDITRRLLHQGFAAAWIEERFRSAYLGQGTGVVAALA